MEDLNLSDEYLVILTTGIVASIRKKFPQIDGILYVSLAIFVVSLIACLASYLSKGGILDLVNLVSILIKSLWVSLVSLAGVNVVSYVLDKKNNGSKNDNGVK